MENTFRPLGNRSYCFDLHKENNSDIAGYLFFKDDGSIIYSPMLFPRMVAPKEAINNFELVMKAFKKFLEEQKYF